MQSIELTLHNLPQTLYAVEDNNKYNKKDVVVVSVNGGLDLAVVKDIIELKQDVEFVQIIRLATESDKKQNCENCKFARSLLPEIKQEAQKLNLNMKIGFISVSLDRNKINVNYTADDRVDFRELIKILGSKYKARIEMRQIGNRDETKQIGAIGVCGRETCCKAFLNDFDKVSIKMAKNQNISLNPNKINGMCGRLLCCFKYEDEYYAEMQKKMPKENSIVSTPDGKGVVTNRDFLKETVTVTFTKDDSTEVKVYDLKDIQFSKDKN
ncbi:MAG: hypothetical protein IJ415_03435 [Clostridia bacterium]|nr:hypothetical protein [Clostridia bacterium]